MPTQEIRGNWDHSGGTFAFRDKISPPSGSIKNTHFTSDTSERLAANKQVHRFDLAYGQLDGTNVVSETKLLRIARGAGELKSVEVRPTTAPTGGDLQYTVDIQKAADASSTWTSMLSSVITLDSTSVDDSLQAGSLKTNGDEDTADGNAIRAVVTTSGSTGSQGQGFVVTCEYEEQSA